MVSPGPGHGISYPRDTCHVEDSLGGFLQVNMETHSTDFLPAQHADVRNMWPILEVKVSSVRQVYQPETVTPLLHFFSQFSKAVVMVLYGFLLMLITVWLLRGLPKKAPQDASVKDGCPRSWLIFLCTTYGFIFCTTDQYVPSLPQMGTDGCGSFRLPRLGFAEHACEKTKIPIVNH